MGRIPWIKIFPFLLLHSWARPSPNEDRTAPSEYLLKRILLFLSLARDGGFNISVVYLLFLLVAATPGLLGVYFLLALSQGFPRLGGRALWVCIVKDLGAIFTLRVLCTCYMAQNSAGFSPSQLATDQFQPGLFSLIRKWAHRLAGVGGELSRPRWFSSFLGDHILLVSVGVPYIVSMALLPLCYWPKYPNKYDEDMIHVLVYVIEAVAVIFRAVQSTYLAVLLMGFLYCTLEHSATFQPRSQGAAKWHLFIFMALWAPQMLVIYKVHKDLHHAHAPTVEAVYERMGVLPQLFVSHSMAMMGAIMLGHHEHFHRSQDLSWRETPFFAVVLVFAGIWHYIIEARGDGQGHPDEHPREFGIARLYVYLFLIFRVTVGVAMLLLALYGRNFRSQQQGVSPSSPRQLRLTITKERSMPPPHWDPASLRPIPSEEEVMDPNEDIVLFDYDGALVLLTFVVANLFPFAMTYAFYSLGLYWSMLAEIVGSLFPPLGCCVFVLVAWRRPPQKTWVWAACLQAGTLMSIGSAMHNGALEDCIVSKGYDVDPVMPAVCCQYPGLWDFNAFKVVVHEKDVMYIKDFCNADRAHARKIIYTEYNSGIRPSVAFDLFQTIGCIGCVEFFFTLMGLFFKLTLRLPAATGLSDLHPDMDGSDHYPRPNGTDGGARLSHRSSGAMELVSRGSDAAFAS